MHREPATQVSRNPYPSRTCRPPPCSSGRRTHAGGHGGPVGPRRCAGAGRLPPAAPAVAPADDSCPRSMTGLGSRPRTRRTWPRRPRRSAGEDRLSARPSGRAISRNWTAEPRPGHRPRARPSAPGVRVARPGPPPSSRSPARLSPPRSGGQFSDRPRPRRPSRRPGVRFPRIRLAGYRGDAFHGSTRVSLAVSGPPFTQPVVQCPRQRTCAYSDRALDGRGASAPETFRRPGVNERWSR